MSFGRRLKEALKYRQISQVDFAKSKKVNMTPQNINQFVIRGGISKMIVR